MLVPIFSNHESYSKSIPQTVVVSQNQEEKKLVVIIARYITLNIYEF